MWETRYLCLIFKQQCSPTECLHPLLWSSHRSSYVSGPMRIKTLEEAEAVRAGKLSPGICWRQPSSNLEDTF